MNKAMEKARPVAWAQDETLHLIQAYQEKWYTLKRGQLKASHWEEVAVTVALRCGYDHSNPSVKSGTQCRQKMEKLRKRYRSLKKRNSASWCSSWLYFELMDCLERGPLPISACPLAVADYHNEESVIDNDNDGDEEDDCCIVGGSTIGDKDEEVGMGLAAEMREFTERVMRMEKKKNKMMREIEGLRMEMENKRFRMIVDSHRKIVDILATIF